jgi:hypothetical protein
MEKSNDLIGNRTRDLLACSIVPHYATLNVNRGRCGPYSHETCLKIFRLHIHYFAKMYCWKDFFKFDMGNHTQNPHKITSY